MSAAYYSPKQIGLVIGFSPSFVLTEIKAGALPAVLIKKPHGRRGRWRIAKADADAYIARMTRAQ